MLFKLFTNLPNAPKVVYEDCKAHQKLQNASGAVKSLSKAFRTL